MKLRKNKLFIGIFLLSIAFISTVSAITINDVSSSPKEIAPGEIANILIELENNFDYDLEGINIKLDLAEIPFAPYESGSEKFLESLDSGDEEEISFKIIALPEIFSGIYKIPVEIKYKDEEGVEKNKTELISLVVNSEPELKASLEDSTILIRGKENEVSIKIVNSGLSDAKFVYLELSESTQVKILSNNLQYVGDIDSDDFDSIEYTLYVNENAEEELKLPLILKYKDSTNKEHIETQYISMKTYSLKEAQKLGFVKAPNYLLPSLGAVILLGYFGYRFQKKRKLKKKKEE